MRNKATDEVRVLRTLLAEIDNAEAVSVGSLHDRYRLSSFGDGTAEAPRKHLTPDDLQELLRRDRDDRLRAAEELEIGGQLERSRELRDQADTVRRYILD